MSDNYFTSIKYTGKPCLKYTCVKNTDFNSGHVNSCIPKTVYYPYRQMKHPPDASGRIVLSFGFHRRTFSKASDYFKTVINNSIIIVIIVLVP